MACTLCVDADVMIQHIRQVTLPDITERLHLLASWRLIDVIRHEEDRRAASTAAVQVGHSVRKNGHCPDMVDNSNAFFYNVCNE